MGRYFLFLPSPFPTLLAFFFFFFCFQGPCLSAGPETPLMVSGSEDAEVEGELTTLQKHVTFFDSNGDGIIYPSETYDGLRSIGVNAALSAATTAFIHGDDSSKTNPGKTDPRLPIYIKNIKLAKHGSDTGAYDTEGRFVPEKFEEIFTKHAHTTPTALTSNELSEMLKANRQPKDSKGWAAAAGEWKVLYDLCKDKDGLLQKETIKAVYDGSLFEQLKQRNSSKMQQTLLLYAHAFVSIAM